MIKVPTSLLEFQKGMSPKSSLDIGYIDSITSRYLELVYVYRTEKDAYDHDIKDPKEYLRDFLDHAGNEQNLDEISTKVEKISKFLSYKVVFGEFCFEKEAVFEEAERFTSQRPDREYFVYNYYPNNPDDPNGWALCFSQIKLPKAEEIDWKSMNPNKRYGFY